MAEWPEGKKGGYKGGDWRPEGSRYNSNYSLNRVGWGMVEAAGLRRAMPTTPRTGTSVRAERGAKMRSALEFRAGGGILMPLSRSERRSVGTTPSRGWPSRNRRRGQRAAS